MSVQAVHDFRQAIGENPELQKKFLELTRSGARGNDWVALGKEFGYDFSVEDLSSVRDDALNSDDFPLTDFETQYVSGGTGSPTVPC